MKPHRLPLIPRSHSALLTTESPDEFEALRTEFRNYIKPQNPIERMYTDEVVNLVWDILRWRRWKLALLKLAFRDALYEALVNSLHKVESGQETAATFDRWFTDAKVRQQTSDILGENKLDETVIDAVAYRLCSADVMRIEQLLAAAELRRDKALHAIALYRQSLAQQLRDQATRVIENDDVERLEFKKVAGQ
ncbi:MAG: hypothetical protein ACREDC_04865 [Bradyrhizobium sp.]